jgi:hypothetical protein
MSPQREELREKLGVINRLWTEFVLSHDFPYYIKVKHRAFQRIWQPYTSEVSGKFVSPVPVSVLAEARATPDASSSAISIVVRREEPPRAEPNVDSSAISSVVQHKEPPQAASDAGPSVVTTVIRYQEPPQAAPDAGSSVVTSVIQYKEPQRIYSDQAIQTEGLSYIDRGVQTEPRYISRDSHSQTDKPCGVSLGSNLNVLTSYLGVAPQPKNDTPRSGKDQGVQTDPLRDQPRDQPREKKERYKLSENTESVTDVVVTSKNLDHCWDCGKTHLRFQPCEAPQQSNSKEQDWEQSKWEEQLKMLAPLPKNNGLQKQNPKQRARKPNKVLTMARSRLVDSDTTVYRIENGEKEIIFDRTDLTLLAPLDREAKRGVVGGSDDESNHNRRPYVKNNSPLARCPNEILEAILTYAADECPSGRKTKVRDIIAGHDFGVDDGVVDNIRKAKNLSGAVKSCRQLRQVAQQVIYKVVSIDKYKALRRFALSLTADPELGKMVQVFRVNLCQTTQSYRNRGLFRYQMENRNVASNTDFASLFVRVVESCPSLQVLSVKMYGSILGFGAVRGKFTKMREICISDPVSSGQVLNQMWNHLTDFPQLQKFKIVHSDINDSVDFEPLEIPYHMADKALDFTFKNLGTLTLENAPEVSDNLLFYIVRRLTALNKLAIVNCKLVSSGGTC